MSRQACETRREGSSLIVAAIGADRIVIYFINESGIACQTEWKDKPHSFLHIRDLRCRSPNSRHFHRVTKMDTINVNLFHTAGGQGCTLGREKVRITNFCHVILIVDYQSVWMFRSSRLMLGKDNRLSSIVSFGCAHILVGGSGVSRNVWSICV